MVFRKVLVANRSEIATRIMQTCAEMGIATVAVFSDADADALHVERADDSIHIGPPPAAQSYLNINRIIEAARQTNADAIHPGYGFLSENPAFAQACAEAGITFIGPPAQAMRLLGSKRAAKRLAREAGVPVVPGYEGPDGDDQLLDTLTREAERIGFPLLIKASAGGGGKGMRTVRSASELADALESARREAQAAFGDDTVLLEKLIERPRHVEIQIVADSHGNVVHLGERDCSSQRRHQKVIEESPSPAVSDALRARMGEAAVALARAAGYVNAGTVEFIVAPDGAFYFLEVNTRLQVEHPVTELVTGLDLVREQLHIAAGESLSFRQEEVTLRGHAIECRMYAEDPAKGFIPSTGALTRCELPHGAGIRVDSGVRPGSEVTPYYDPMLAKLIVHARTREAAIERARVAVRRCAIEGVTTNLPLLAAILDSETFRAGEVTTRFLDERIHDLLAKAPLPPEPEVPPSSRPISFNPWRAIRGTLRSPGPPSSNWGFDPSGRLGARPPGPPSDMRRRGEEGHRGRSPGREVRRAEPSAGPGEARQTQLGGQGSAASPGQRSDAGSAVVAPLTGTVAKLPVSQGDAVDAGQTLVVLEAMKMEIAVEAPRAGHITKIACAPGDLVQSGQVLAEIGE